MGAVALPDLGVLAAAEAGIVLERLVLVPAPGAQRWGAAIAALLDAVDVVMAGCPGRPRAAEARGLAARARERGAVLVPVGGGWPAPPDLAMTVVAARWEGLGQGAGHLVRRRVEVVAGGRGAAARARRAVLWLPG